MSLKSLGQRKDASFNELLVFSIILSLRTILYAKKAVIFDWDGPCSLVFKKYPADKIARRLRLEFAALVSHWFTMQKNHCF